MIITGFTPLNTQNCILNESRIDLWQFSLDYELHSAYQLLNADERSRADRFILIAIKDALPTPEQL